VTEVTGRFNTELVRNGLEFLKTHEWGQGDYRSLDGNGRMCYCLIGALAEGNMSSSLEIGTSSELEFIRSFLGRPVHKWNDEPGRTKQDVLDLLERAVVEMERVNAERAAGIP